MCLKGLVTAAFRSSEPFYMENGRVVRCHSYIESLPTLINSVTNINLSNGSTLVLYADDMLLFKPISSENDYSNLQGDVDSLKDWSASHFLTFNPSKCKYMLLSKKNKPTKIPSVLTIDNIPIERTNLNKYLGIVLTSNLTWSEHIHCICSKAKKLLGLFYRQFYIQEL